MKALSLKHFRLTLPANGIEKTKDVDGNFFICVNYDSTDPFYISLNGGDYFPWQMGLKMQLPEKIERITFKQNSATDKVVEFYIGNANIEDARLNIITANALLVNNQNPSTLLKNNATASLAAGASVTVQGEENANGRTRRKEIIITNLSETLKLQVLDSADNVLATIFPEMPWAIETDDDLKIKNPNGDAVDLNICEIFYTS